MRRLTAPVRVGYVVSNLEVGGLQQAIFNTARLLDPDRVVADVVVLRRPSGTSEVMYKRFADAGVRVHDLHLSARSDRSPLGAIRAVRALRAHIRTARYEILDSATLEADLVSRLAARGLATQVTHLINLSYEYVRAEPQVTRARWRPYAAQLVDGVSARLTTHFIAISQAVADSWRPTLRLRRDRITVIPRGVDAREFPRRLGTTGVGRLLCIGRLTESKGQSTAIRALAELVARGHDLHLTVAGEGPLRSDLERLAAQLGVRDRVQIGSLTARPAELFASHGVFVFPSRWEGLGNALLEAMASGRPAVVSDLPVFHEVLGDLGRYAPVDDVPAFAARIEELVALEPDVLETMSRALSGRATERFDLAEVNGALMGLYEELARARP
jgi:glycosyltransferase involved in cell wall biosynthesis